MRHRFDVFARQNSDFYRIYDRLTCQGCLIWSGNLKNPYFRLGEWYARWRSRKNKLSERPKRPWTMGDAYGYNAMLVLRSGIPTLYPTVNPEINNEFRITVVQKSDDQYFIHDEDFHKPLTVDKSILTNSRFDLGNWYHTRRLPKPLNVWDDDQIVDLSIFTPEDDDLPELYPESDSDSDDEGPPGLYPISEEDFDEESDQLTEPISEGEQTDSSNDDTVVSESGSETEALERPYYPIGDILGTTVALILDASGPYPGDSLYPQSRRSRFTVYRVEGDFFRIEDRLQRSQATLALGLTRDPTFSPSCWYAHRCSIRSGLSSNRWLDSTPHLTMGNVLEREILKDLQHGVPYRFDEEYTNVPSSRRFRVYLDPYDDNLFIIQDVQWNAWIRLPRELAENPAFDVADWYESQLLGQLDFFVCPDLPPINKSGYEPDDDAGGSGIHADDSRTVLPCRYSTNNVLARKPDLETDQWNGRNLQVNGIQVPRGVYPAVQRNAAVTKDITRTVP